MGNERDSWIFRWLRLLRYRGHRLRRWLNERSTKRDYQIMVSIVIGIVAGLVAVLMKFLVHAVRDWMHGNDPTRGQLGFVFFPLIGILLTVVFRRFLLRRPMVAGLSSLIHAISSKKVNLPAYETYAYVVASSLTVGFGGSVGLEAPIIKTGAAVGSNVAQALQAGRRRQTLFLACGAAGGMAAIFNSPVAGVIFAFEVLLGDIAVHSFIPLLISAATGAVIAKMLYYEQIFFLPTDGWELPAIPFYLLLGACCGLYSVYMIRISTWFDRYFDRQRPVYLKYGLGGLGLGLLIFLMPPLFGEGYDTINDLLTGRFDQLAAHSFFYRFGGWDFFLIGFALIIILAKAFAAALTNALGGIGGKFAPSMFSGALLGFAFAHGVNQLGWVQLNTANFIAVAMGGLLSGVFKSPLTGIFLIAEITGGYGLFVPLMLVSALSYFIALYFEPFSIFTKELYQQGLWVPTHERDRSILQNMNVAALLETNFRVVHPEMTMGEFVRVIAKSKRNVFPVVDEREHLRGVVLLDDVREIMFDIRQYDLVRVRDVMHIPPAVIDVHDPMERVMDRFDHHNAWNLPVVDAGRYLGFVSKSSVFNRYRQLLIERSRDA